MENKMETLKRLLENSREANEKLVSLVELKMKRRDDVIVNFRQVLKMIYDSNCALSLFMIEVDANKYKDLAYDITLKNKAIREIINEHTLISEDETKESVEMKMLDEYISKIHNR